MGKSLEAGKGFCEQQSGPGGKWREGCNRSRGQKARGIGPGLQSRGGMLPAWQAAGSVHSLGSYFLGICPRPSLQVPRD